MYVNLFLCINITRMKKEKIAIIITWWTIDSHYDGKKDTAVPNQISIIPRYLESLQTKFRFEFHHICMKDSRAINKTDLNKILNAIKNSTATKYVVTHGTYTMPDSARYISAKLKAKNKVVIFTGSMLPMAEFTLSDGWFNLWFSIASFSHITPGTYVCMNGTMFTANEALKIVSEGRFGSVYE